MIKQKNVFSLSDFGNKRQRRNFPPLLSHNQNKVGISGSSKRKSKDLVGLLLGYGARTRRAAMPKVLVHMEVFTASGKHAVKIKLK